MRTMEAKVAITAWVIYFYDNLIVFISYTGQWLFLATYFGILIMSLTSVEEIKESLSVFAITVNDDDVLFKC